MKKTIIAALMICFSTLTSKAQNEGFAKGDKLLNLGIGVNSPSDYGTGIPLSVSFEVAASKAISLGVSIDDLSTKWSDGSYNYKFSIIYYGARASYHLGQLLNINSDKVDLYAGATIGYRTLTVKVEGAGTYDFTGDAFGNGIYLGGHLGGKYFFNKKIGGFLEVGAFGSTNARLGLAIKF